MDQPSLEPRGGKLRRRRARARGLAPLELVLWLPVLLLVVALIVNYGTMATWRIRGEVVSHDAAFRDRWGRTGGDEGRLRGQWPPSASMTTVADPPMAELDHPFLQHEVVRGPLPNGWIVQPVLDPDHVGTYRGSADVVRRFPLLPRLGLYESGEIAHSMLDRTWNNREMGIPNQHRRIPVLYQLPRTDPALPQAFRTALVSLLGIPHFAALEILDNDSDLRLILGAPPDFHPRAGPGCELDPEVVFETYVQRLIDHRDERGRLVLGRISRLPGRMTGTFLQTYRNYVQALESRINALQNELNNIPPPPPGRVAQIQEEIQRLQQEVERIEPKIEQLEDYSGRLPQIERDLRDAASTALP